MSSVDSTPEDRLDLAPEARFPKPGPEKKSLWRKLKRGLLMTHTEIIERVDAALEGRATLDEETLEFLEESLIASDLGVETSLELVEKVRAKVRRGDAGDLGRLHRLLTDEVTAILEEAKAPEPGSGPTVTLVVGVNGVGKTTSIATCARSTSPTTSPIWRMRPARRCGSALSRSSTPSPTPR